MNATDGPTGEQGNGSSTGQEARRMAEKLRSSGSAAAETVRDQARMAQDWARSQMSHLQTRVQSDPYKATMWAMGFGVVAGLLLATLMMRGGRSSDR